MTTLSSAEETQILDAHNKYRAEVATKYPVPPLSPLVWFASLARAAQVWANRLASEPRREYPHEPGITDGENIARDFSAGDDVTGLVAGWAAEDRFFQNSADGKFTFDHHGPGVSSTGNWADVGHYTQMVWRNTTEVGCARATGPTGNYLVARYRPPGNYDDESVF